MAKVKETKPDTTSPIVIGEASQRVRVIVQLLDATGKVLRDTKRAVIFVNTEDLKTVVDVVATNLQQKFGK